MPTEETLQLTLYWAGVDQINLDYTAFVHILDQSGQMVAQLDRPPTAGAYPTSLWEPGEIIVDSMAVPISIEEANSYTVVVGLYDLATGARLKINDSNEDAIRVATF